MESPIKGRIIARGEAVHPFSIKGAEVNLFALIFVMSKVGITGRQPGRAEKVTLG